MCEIQGSTSLQHVLLKHFFMCMRVCLHVSTYICVCVCTICTQCLRRPEEGTESPRTGTTNSYGLPCAFWEWNLWNLGLQQVFLTAKLSLQNPNLSIYLKKKKKKKKPLHPTFSFSLLISEYWFQKQCLPEFGTVWYSWRGPAVVPHPPFPPSQGIQTLLHTGLKGWSGI
jgi:hypothetical protein